MRHNIKQIMREKHTLQDFNKGNILTTQEHAQNVREITCIVIVDNHSGERKKKTHSVLTPEKYVKTKI